MDAPGDIKSKNWLDVINKKPDAKIAIIVVIAIVLGATSIVFTGLGFSDGGIHDAEYFMPAAINFTTGHGLTDTIVRKVTDWGDPTGQGRYLFYPPLFPMVISAFIGPSSHVSYPQQTFIVAGIMNALAILLACLIFFEIASLHGKKLDWFAAIFISALLLFMLRTSLKFAGRPETLARLFLSLGLLLMLRIPRSRMLAVSLAVLLGLTAATHPVGAIFFALVIGLYFSFQYAWKNAFRQIAAVYFLSALSFFLVMQLSPFSVRDTLAGTFGHGTMVFSVIGFLGSLYASLGPYFLVYDIVVFFTAFLGVQFYIRFRRKVQAPFFFVGFAVLMSVFLAYFLVVEAKTYYLNAFFIFIFAFLVYYIIHFTNARYIKYCTLACVAFLSFFSLQAMFLFPFFLKNGVGLAAAREKFLEASVQYPHRNILVTVYSWVVSEEYARMIRLDDARPYDMHNAIIVLDQTYAKAVAPPPAMDGCPLAVNYFVGGVPKIFGIPISPMMPGYGFALYKCE